MSNVNIIDMFGKTTLKQIENPVKATFEYKSHGTTFNIEIVKEEKDVTEAWLYHKNYGIKSLMFGLTGKVHVMEIVEPNLPDYVESYIDEYMPEYKED